ncbi:MAG: DUF2147 domain-containing protein [Pseudomonadota bacterium]
MKTLIAAAAAAILGSAAMADDVLGTWQSEASDTGAFIQVNMVPCGSSICGMITAVGGDGDQSIVGRQIIAGMASEGDGKYRGGTIWAPDEDKVYKSKMDLSGNALEVSGCVLGGLVCRGQTWSRVN